MITQEAFDNLMPGDQIEAGIPFSGMSEEPIVWEMVQRDDKGVLLTAMYYGAILGSYHLSLSKRAQRGYVLKESSHGLQ